MSEQLQPYFDKKEKCPNCTHDFLTKRIRSRFVKIDRIEPDFFTVYKDEKFNPIFYEVSVCPKCGYAYTNAFSPSLNEEQKKLIHSQITANWKERDYGDIRTIEQTIEVYKLALISGLLKKEKSIVMAGISLRLAWLYRMCEDEEQEKRFMQIALEKYLASYVEADYIGTQMSEMRLFYLIGELSRKVGDREGAIRYFSKVINHKNRAIETKIVQMAREQWYVVREEEKQEKQQNI